MEEEINHITVIDQNKLKKKEYNAKYRDKVAKQVILASEIPIISEKPVVNEESCVLEKLTNEKLELEKRIIELELKFNTISEPKEQTYIGSVDQKDVVEVEDEEEPEVMYIDDIQLLISKTLDEKLNFFLQNQKMNTSQTIQPTLVTEPKSTWIRDMALALSIATLPPILNMLVMKKLNNPAGQRQSASSNVPLQNQNVTHGFNHGYNHY